ncbi:hypothetical protein C427_5629 [Paraglaciecola psychrophila 170]|uniref:Uncharacterized protein n=1 Tax=Paraglaciecola psychrophila 170 TaxID=1129794 RepID=K6YT13_9ALTE|nr:hypothetical protein C427_5629 [Paraglaciecola psychrophila 170]GAC35854.1 hypothetical protein GPSY_0212 [Paraglaciecola psychrophila 170]
MPISIPISIFMSHLFSPFQSCLPFNYVGYVNLSEYFDRIKLYK